MVQDLWSHANYFGQKELSLLCERTVLGLFPTAGVSSTVSTPETEVGDPMESPSSYIPVSRMTNPDSVVEEDEVPNLGKWTSYVLYRTALSPLVVMHALHLLRRLSSEYDYDPNPSSASLALRPKTFHHRLLFAALVLALKYSMDDAYNNQSWSIASGNLFSIAEINEMEISMLGALGWTLRAEGETDLMALLEAYQERWKEGVRTRAREKKMRGEREAREMERRRESTRERKLKEKKKELERQKEEARLKLEREEEERKEGERRIELERKEKEIQRREEEMRRQEEEERRRKWEMMMQEEVEEELGMEMGTDGHQDYNFQDLRLREEHGIESARYLGSQFALAFTPIDSNNASLPLLTVSPARSCPQSLITGSPLLSISSNTNSGHDCLPNLSITIPTKPPDIQPSIGGKPTSPCSISTQDAARAIVAVAVVTAAESISPISPLAPSMSTPFLASNPHGMATTRYPYTWPLRRPSVHEEIESQNLSHLLAALSTPSPVPCLNELEKQHISKMGSPTISGCCFKRRATKAAVLETANHISSKPPMVQSRAVAT